MNRFETVDRRVIYMLVMRLLNRPENADVITDKYEQQPVKEWLEQFDNIPDYDLMFFVFWIVRRCARQR